MNINKVYLVSIPVILLSLFIGVASMNAETPDEEYPQDWVDNCPQKISTQAYCDIVASDHNAATLTLLVYEGYDTKRIQKTLDALTRKGYTQDTWIENSAAVGTKYAGLELVNINPTDGHFRDEMVPKTLSDGRVVYGLPEPQTAREKSANPKTAVDWGREASEFFVEFYDENDTLITTKTYYILNNGDPNLEGTHIPPVVRDPVKVTETEQTTSSNTRTTTRNRKSNDDTDDETTQENTQNEDTDDQQDAPEESTQATEPETTPSTQNVPAPTPTFYYIADKSTMVACYTLETTGIPTESSPMFYYIPDQNMMMQCYIV